jgi:hypothetical protein
MISTAIFGVQALRSKWARSRRAASGSGAFLSDQLGRGQHAHRTPRRDAVQEGALGPDRVHDREEVVGPLLEAPEPERAVGEAGPPLVEGDHPGDAVQLSDPRDIG